MYRDGPLFRPYCQQLKTCSGAFAEQFSAPVPQVANYCSLVDRRCRLSRNSRTAEWAYRTARPILMKRGPVPLSRDLASQEIETPSSLATCAVCNRGSISLALGELMAHLLRCWRWTEASHEGFRKKSDFLRQIPRPSWPIRQLPPHSVIRCAAPLVL